MSAGGNGAASGPRGGAFLIEDPGPGDVFTPEDLDDEQRLIAQTCTRWMENDVLPRLPEILALDYETIRRLLRRGGELGLLGVEIPAAYGGLGMGKVSACVVAENVTRDGSFAVTVSCHTGIGSLPIVYFGSEPQKRRYLPKLASGEWVGAYSLSESSSASDAMNAKARAVPSPDGKSWILNGEKMWLTNAGIADVYTTFAKVNGTDLTAFVIEKGMPGVSLGPEEKKTGIKGSSTRPLILADAVIPRENLLGEIGKGHKIAFNVLNLGRFKLGAGVTGGAKLAIGQAVAYAKGRSAFGQPISDFGLIRHKIGEMAIRAYVAESLVYRTAGAIDRNLEAAAAGDAADELRRIEEYDVECSMVKVFCSEMLDYVVDETVQIFGGAGYVQDFPAERYWRDARVNRIFEGTNEINRLLVPGRLLRRALRGELPLFERALALAGELDAPAGARRDDGDGGRLLAAEARQLAGAKKVALLCLGLAAQKHGAGLANEQEVLGGFADVAMETYALESALLRTRKIAAAAGAERAALQVAATLCFAQDALDRIDVSARRLMAALETGDKLRATLAAFARFTARETLDTVALRRQVAIATVESGGYPFGNPK